MPSLALKSSWLSWQTSNKVSLLPLARLSSHLGFRNLEQVFYNMCGKAGQVAVLILSLQQRYFILAQRLTVLQMRRTGQARMRSVVKFLGILNWFLRSLNLGKIIVEALLERILGCLRIIFLISRSLRKVFYFRQPSIRNLWLPIEFQRNSGQPVIICFTSWWEKPLPIRNQIFRQVRMRSIAVMKGNLRLIWPSSSPFKSIKSLQNQSFFWNSFSQNLAISLGHRSNTWLICFMSRLSKPPIFSSLAFISLGPRSRRLSQSKNRYFGYLSALIDLRQVQSSTNLSSDPSRSGLLATTHCICCLVNLA